MDLGIIDKTSQTVSHWQQQSKWRQILGRIQGKRNPWSLLAGMWAAAAAKKIGMEVFKGTDQSYRMTSLHHCCIRARRTRGLHMTEIPAQSSSWLCDSLHMRCKQLSCPSADERIMNSWCIHISEFHLLMEMKSLGGAGDHYVGKISQMQRDIESVFSHRQI